MVNGVLSMRVGAREIYPAILLRLFARVEFDETNPFRREIGFLDDEIGINI